MRVAKWGDSLAVRLPKGLVDSLSLKAGDELAIVDATRERLALAKDERRKQALERLAAMKIKLPEDYEFDREEANERAREERRKQALGNMRARRWKLPSDYRLDRGQANSR